MKSFHLTLLTFFLLAGCTYIDTPFSKNKTPEKFEDQKEMISLNDYWYQGEAQVLTYNLTQNRYDNTHPGEAVLIQVSEPFNTDMQVKSDGVNKEANTATVLKTNIIERFTTGMYDYSMMTSVFTGVKDPFPTYKVTHSSQDWCGQSMAQLNKKEHTFRFQLHSYFESEGDRDVLMPEVILEDELFNLIRMSPGKIVAGDVKMLPSMKVMRLLHLPLEPVEASIDVEITRDTSMVHIEMPTLKRNKTIYFLNQMPHTITGWEDTYPSVFDHQLRTTKAYLKGWKKIDYWNYNKLNNMSIREELGLKLY